MHAPVQPVNETKTTVVPSAGSAHAGTGPAFEDNRPEAVAQRRLKAASERYVPIIQLKKVEKLTPGKLNVVGEDHARSGLRRGEEITLAVNNQLSYRMEDQARGKDAFPAGEGFDASYGDPPWLREVNRSYHVVYQTNRFVRHVQAGRTDIDEVYGKLREYLDFSFQQRRSWWPHRKKLYKGAVHQFDTVNERVLETCFHITEQCLAIAMGLAGLYNKSAPKKELSLLNINAGVRTGEPVAVIQAASLTDTAWMAGCNAVQEALAGSFGVYFGMSKAAFGKVSTRRTDFMHDWAEQNSSQPMLWKIGDDHLGEIDQKYGLQTTYDYMTMVDFERYFAGSVAGAAAGAGSGAAAAASKTAPAGGSGGGAAVLSEPVTTAAPKTALPATALPITAASGAAADSNAKPVMSPAAKPFVPSVPTVSASGAVRSRRDFNVQAGQKPKMKKV